MTLVRRTLPGVFSFEYELPTPYNVTETPKSLNLENELPSVLQFEIGSNDIGGTLSVELYLDHSRVSWFFVGYLDMKVDGIEWIDLISSLKMCCLKNDNEAVILSKLWWKIKCEIFWNQGRRRGGSFWKLLAKMLQYQVKPLGIWIILSLIRMK